VDLTHWLLHNKNLFLSSAYNIFIHFNGRVPDPEGKLPEETLDASGLKRNFQKKGFS
jgi:hypothetical protein